MEVTMKLSIIILHNNEPDITMHPLLNSINSQVGVDFKDVEVLICNDGEKDINHDIFEKYPNIINSRGFKIVNSTILNNLAMNRQSGLMNATGEYIMWFDADDMLYSNLTLHDILIHLRSGEDVIEFKFTGERADGTFYVEDFNQTWLFAKAFKREFLIRNNVNLTENIRYHEDTYYNLKVKYHFPTIKCVNEIVYIWKFNINSVSRKNGGYYLFGYEDQKLDIVGDVLAQALTQVPITSRDIVLDDVLRYMAEAYWMAQGDYMWNSGLNYAAIKKATLRFVERFKIVDFLKKDKMYVGKAVSRLNKFEFNPAETLYQFLDIKLEIN